MNIPEAAVEAAAREAFFVDDIGGHIRGRWTWETIPEDGRDNYRKLALAVAAAAAPHMLAGARGELVKLAQEFDATTSGTLAYTASDGRFTMRKNAHDQLMYIVDNHLADT